MNLIVIFFNKRGEVYSDYWRVTRQKLDASGGKGLALEKDTAENRLARRSRIYSVLWVWWDEKSHPLLQSARTWLSSCRQSTAKKKWSLPVEVKWPQWKIPVNSQKLPKVVNTDGSVMENLWKLQAMMILLKHGVLPKSTTKRRV